jgi:hypothetical protein
VAALSQEGKYVVMEDRGRGVGKRRVRNAMKKRNNQANREISLLRKRGGE